MSKLKNSVKKGTLWSVIVVIVIAVGIVLGAIFGLNASDSLKDAKTLTVTMNTYAYNNQLEAVEDECEKAIGSLNVKYEVKSQMSGDDCEIVYVFASDVDLTNVESDLKNAFETLTADGGALEGSFINVSAASEKVQATLAKNYVLRVTIAVVVISALAFAYVAIRHSLGMGITAAASAIVGAGVTFAIGVFTRIPAATSYSYVVALGALVSLVASVLTLNKVRANLNAEEPADETVAKSIPVAEIAWLAILVSAAMLVVGVVSIIGAGAFTAVAWFAIASIIAMAVAAFVGIIYTPALYCLLRNSVDKNLGSDASAYVGAQKTSTKVKKVFQKKEAVKEAPKAEEVKEEAPCCCGCADCAETKEEVVEEAEVVEEVAEEVVEETTEEVAEEAPCCCDCAECAQAEETEEVAEAVVEAVEETAEVAEQAVEAVEVVEEATANEENND